MNEKYIVWLVLGLLAIWMLDSWDVIDISSYFGKGKALESDTTRPSTELGCAVEDVTVTLESREKWNPGTEQTSGAHRVLLKENHVWKDKGYYYEGNSIQMSPGNNIKVLFALNSSSHYPAIVDAVIGYPEGLDRPCKGTHTIEAELVAWDTAPSVSCWSPDGLLATKNESGKQWAYDLDANDVKTFNCEIDTTSEDGFGIPEADNILVVELNSTWGNKIGSDLEETSTPDIHTDNAITDNYAFKFPYVENGNTQKFTFTVEVASTGPTEDAAASSNQINITLYDGCVFLDPDTNEVTFGVEDSDNTDKCQTTSASFETRVYIH